MAEKGHEFEIIVSTSGRFAAGTDARVFITITGTEGVTDEIELKDSTKGRKLFEAGNNDKIVIKVNKNIGIITKINIRHDDSGAFSGWHLNMVKINDHESGREYKFPCHRWLAKDEGDKKISVELESTAVAVVKTDQLNAKNRPLHNTTKFTSMQFMIRRGQLFYMNMHLARPYNAEKDDFHITLTTGKKPREFDKSFVHIRKVEEFDALNQEWGYKIIDMKDDVLQLEINCPSDALVAKYEMVFEDDEDVIYKHPSPLYVLFNPWNKVDDVYMEDEEWRNEYVLRQHGAIYVGNSRYQNGRDWYFGQFEEVSLECAFELLDQTKPLGREKSIEVARRLSSLVNSCDNRGLLVGNWSGDYEGGKSPTYWTSSPPIFEEYMKTKKSVKYGQCWVFSALLTTVLRTLGIPCRSVTNFNSAHDTNLNISKDIYLDEEGNEIDGMSSDSIWNFHCWNDAWMARPDLKPGFGGWQVVDATPQESSEGKYQCGPCSLRAIKEGEVDAAYDGKFILAEVNSDIFYHKKNEQGKWEVVRTNRSHVGKKISTKAIGKQSRQDITKDYKFPENSILERASVRKALSKAGNVNVISTPQTLEMKVRPTDDVVTIGNDIEVNVFLKNVGEQDLTLRLIVGGSVVRYTGVSKGDLNNQRRNETIAAQQEKTVKFMLKAHKYMEYLYEYSMIRFYVTCTVKETKQVCTSSKVVDVKRPELKFTDVPKQVNLGNEFKMKVNIENPLQVKLSNCELHFDGTLMNERIALPCGDIPPKGVSDVLVSITPNTYPGTRSLLATFTSKQLAGLHSSMKFKVA